MDSDVLLSHNELMNERTNIKQAFQTHFIHFFYCFIKISLKWFPQEKTVNMSSLIQVMARQQTNDKPLIEPTYFILTDCNQNNLLKKHNGSQLSVIWNLCT